VATLRRHAFAAAPSLQGGTRAANPDQRQNGAVSEKDQLYRATFALTGIRAGLAGGGARRVTLIPVGANADWYETKICSH
jgi:hypothetical protein